MDARERRRQRAADSKPEFNAVDFLKKFRVPIVILLLLGGGTAIALTTGSSGPECPGHWHANMHVYVNGERLPFTHPAFQQDGSGDAAGFHLHQGSELLHMHPAGGQVIRCIPTEAILGHLDLEVSSNRIDVGDAYGTMAGSYAVNETHTLSIYTREYDSEEWKKRSMAFLDDQIGQGMDVLITYGDVDDATLGAQQSAFPALPANYQPREADASAEAQKDFVAIMAMSLFAILAIALWYNFAKKSW